MRPSDQMPSDLLRLREDELLRLFCHHRDRGDAARAREMWEALTIRSYDRIAGMVRAFRFPGGDRLPAADAADAAQEAYLRVAAMGTSFREAALGQFRAALRTCVHNSCMDYGRRELRHERRRGGSLDEPYDDDAGTSRYEAAIGRASVEREQIAAEAEAQEARLLDQRAFVARAIARVRNPNHRAVLELTYLERLSGEQIAERLGITPDNVYARRSRGCKQLEAILRDRDA